MTPTKETTSNNFSIALSLRAYGLSCLPIIPMSKKALIPWERYRTQKPTVCDYAKWFIDSNANIAVLCGSVSSNLVVLDFDSVGAYFLTRMDYPLLKETYTVKSARGFHCYLFVNELPTKTLKAEGIDIKASGYVLCPPSIHPSGIRYEVKNDAEIVRVDSLAVVGIVEPETPRIQEPPSAPVVAPTVDTLYPRRSLVTEVKSRTKITQLFPIVTELGQDMALAKCPTSVHSNGDRNPSLSLDTKNNRCRCFNPSCPLHTPRGNDVIDAYATLHNLSFKAALAQMASELGL